MFFHNFGNLFENIAIMDDQQKDNYNSKYLCRLLAEYRKSVLIILIAAALLAVLFSSPLFITPLYKSTAILYPTSSNSISKVLITHSLLVSLSRGNLAI